MKKGTSKIRLPNEELTECTGYSARSYCLHPVVST